MIVGTLNIDLFIHESHSLKDRRRVVKSIKDRIRARFNAAVAEVGNLEDWHRATLGFAVVSNDLQLVHASLSKILAAVENMYLAEITSHRVEIL